MSSNISIIGAGTMGGSIAQLLAISTSVEKVTIFLQKEEIDNHISRISGYLEKQVEKGKVLPELVDSFEERFLFTDNYAKLTESKLIIEAITENAQIKKSLYKEISSYVSEDMILATNTSSLSITDLASSYAFPHRFIGMHFFNPAPVMELSEVIVGLKTEGDVVESSLEFLKGIGKQPIVVNESPGFVVNRMLIPMINEAITVLAEGVASAEDIDKAMRLACHHPMGPLALADFIGNDINLSIMETLFEETGDPKYRPHPLLRKMVRANYLGRKTSRGFFEYQC